MFRNQMNSQQASPPEIALDAEDNYEFTSSTLKISTNMEQTPAVLSGTDVVSPIPGSPVASNTLRNNNEETAGGAATTGTTTTLATTDPTKSAIGSPRHFFSFRQGLFDQAVNDTISILLRPMNDVDLQGSWLLTEISHWDHEKEKIVILTSRSLLTVKYDFIAMRILDHKKTQLNKIDKILKGALSYPTSSLIPRFEGLTNGVASLFRGGIFLPTENVNRNTCTNGFKLAEALSFANFHPVERNNPGIRIMWNKGQALPVATSWNPFTRDIPWKTFTNHPLHGYEDKFNTMPPMQQELNEKRLIYSIDNFHQALAQLFSTPATIDNNNINYTCQFEEAPIVQQNYLGLGALVHNKNNLGFFKVRGKFSF